MDSAARDKAQKQFDRSSVRCVVATVAFGMGVDKADVRQVVHNSMPKSVENYVQVRGGLCCGL
jgi:ATP-dependent DNA helicase RecQ